MHFACCSALIFTFPFCPAKTTTSAPDSAPSHDRDDHRRREGNRETSHPGNPADDCRGGEEERFPRKGDRNRIRRRNDGREPGWTSTAGQRSANLRYRICASDLQRPPGEAKS